MNTDGKKIIKFSLIFIFSLSIIVYAFFGARNILLGVKIKGVNIVDGATVTESILKIEGNAKNATKLLLNGREIFIDQKGNWSETIALLLGYNTVIIEAEDKFGNKDEKIYKLILKEESQGSQILENTVEEKEETIITNETVE